MPHAKPSRYLGTSSKRGIVRRALQLVRVATATLLVSSAAQAQNAAIDVYGPWQSMGSNISIRFVQRAREKSNAAAGIWTWQFRNDDSRKITSLEFGYTDIEGDHHDILPSPLAAGKAFGDWTAFEARTRPSRVWITKLEYAGQKEAKEAGVETREALDAYRAAVDRAERYRSANPSASAALQKARSNVEAFERRFGTPMSEDRVPEIEAQLRTDIALATTDLESAVQAVERESSTTQQGTATRGTGVSGGGVSSAGTTSATGGSTASPNLTPEEVDGLALLLQAPFVMANPKYFAQGAFTGEASVGVNYEQRNGVAFGERNSSNIATNGFRFPFGTSYAGSMSRIFWSGADSVPTIRRVGVELSVDGGQSSVNWNDQGYLGHYSIRSNHATAGGTLWLGPIGAGFVYSREYINAKSDSLHSNSGLSSVSDKYVRSLSGPTLALANNDYPGLRIAVRGYYLHSNSTGNSPSGSWSSATIIPQSQSNIVTGVEAELGIGAYFLRATQRWEQFALTAIAERFEQERTFSAGLRMPF
jgi:hypothetical protein